MAKLPELRSTIVCPSCGHNEAETMPTDACQWYYECRGVVNCCDPSRETAVCFVPTAMFPVRLSK